MQNYNKGKEKLKKEFNLAKLMMNIRTLKYEVGKIQEKLDLKNLFTEDNNVDAKIFDIKNDDHFIHSE